MRANKGDRVMSGYFRMGRIRLLFLVTCWSLVVAVCDLSTGLAQEKSVKPGINDAFRNPDVKEFQGKFETESREVFVRRKEIVAACAIKPGQVVADIGAGTGLFTRLFADAVGKDGRVVAVDIAQKFLDHIQISSREAGLKNIETRLCAADSTALEPESVDVAYICDTYHHFEFPRKTMTSLHAALKPGGRVILIDFRRVEGKSTDWVMGHVRAGQDVFEEEIVRSGYRKVREEPDLLSENYFVVFEKVPEGEWNPDVVRLDLEAASKQFSEAFAAADAEKVAALFTAEAEYINLNGDVFHGRRLIADEFAAMFKAGLLGKLSIAVTSVRPIAATVIVEEGITRFLPKGGPSGQPIQYVATHVRQSDGTWLLAGVRELSAVEPTAHQRLQTLSWLVGKWRDESESHVLTSEWNWTDDGSFLEARFALTRREAGRFAGTHRVGWDPLRKQFRSWVFEADGGSATGWWTEANGIWTVHLTGAYSNGDSVSMTLSYERDGEHAFLFTQGNRVVGGRALPDFQARIVRQPPVAMPENTPVETPEKKPDEPARPAGTDK